MNRKPFLVALAELLVAYRPRFNLGQCRWLSRLLPTPGNALFTLLVLAGLVWAQSAGALPQSAIRNPQSTSTGTIAYQGRLADANGNPITGTYNMIFRLYDVASGGVPLWTEQWTGSNSVRVSDGLFNMMLGSLTPIPQSVVTGHTSLWLGITVGTDDEMTPRVQLGSVPFAVQALTVPDGSVTTEKIADGAVTAAKLNVDNMGRNTWTITTAGSPLQNWDVEETWIHSGGNLYFVQWTLGLDSPPESNYIYVPANSRTAIALTNWNTQEFASSRFANMEGRSYLTGVSSVTNLINLTYWASDPTVVDFAVYNGIGGVNGASFTFSNPSSNDAVVRSFSIQGFVRMP